MKMLSCFVKSLDELDSDQRAYYVEADGGFALAPGLEQLADQHNELLRQIESLQAAKVSEVAEARQQIAAARLEADFDAALLATNVPGRFHAAVKALLKGHVPEGRSVEGVVREFLDGDDGAAYRSNQEPAPYFSSRLRVVK